MPILQINAVNKQYGNYQALNNVSFNVEPGKIFGLLGPNGAGKTTLIRILNNITAPDSGEVLFNGHHLTAKDTANIGYLPEERGLYKKMKVGEQAMYLCQLKGLSKQEAKQKLKYWFEKFEIEGWWNKKVEELSKGMAQKIQFITTVLHEPELLIFDEPFSGFDPLNTKLIKNEMLELNKKGATIIFSTHNMESVEEICQDIALINQAKLVLEGSVDEIKLSHRAKKFKLLLEQGTLPQSSNYDILSSKKTIFGTEYILLLKTMSGNEFLTQCLPLGRVNAFEELLPSMNDIFIRRVTEGK